MVSFNNNSKSIFNNHISVKVASLETGYSLQYIRRLLRKGILEGEKIGQMLLVDLGSLEKYFEKVNTASDSRFGPKTY